MRLIERSLLAGVSLLSVAGPAFAQTAPEEESTGVVANEIVVQARRRDESVQDVPVVVNAVTSEALTKLNIREFNDITSVVPGLSLAPTASGIGGGVSTIRGVNFDTYASGSNGTVEFYLNDAPIPSGVIYQAMYDIGQIEVLRGPQGTLRGRASPSGSITVTTRKPDLYQAGGYMMGTVNDQHGHNVNGAINVPIIEGKLGIRVAGLTSQGRGNRVTPVEGTSFTPSNDTESLRASVSADPFDGVLLLDFSYLTLNRDSLQYDQVESMDQVITDGSIAPSPVTIRARDRNAYRGLPYRFNQQFRNYNWQARLSQWGQQLTYVGNHYTQFVDSREPMDKAGIFADPVDPTGRTFNQIAINDSTYKAHEIRLQNQERLFDMFDYVIGGMSYKANTPTAMQQLRAADATLTPEPILDSTLFTPLDRYSKTKEESIFGNLSVNFGQGTELSGGLRKIWYEYNSGGKVSGVDIPSIHREGKEGKTIYTASIKHRFNDALMAYASTGSSWRPSITAVGGPTAPSDLQNSFINLPAETSRSYEIGIKSNWFNDRLTVNLTAYHQKFRNSPYRAAGAGVYAIDRSGATPVVKPFNYVAAVPIKVKGFELEVAGKPTDRWNISASVSYADGKISNGTIPCVDLNGDGVPDTLLAAPTLADMEAAVGTDNIATCKANFRSNNSSPWSASVQSEYSVPINDKADAYLRGLFSWQGNSIGDPGNAFDSVESYGLLNLFLGVRSPDNSWDVTAYAKNLTNTFRVLTRSNGPLSTTLTNPGTQSYTNYFGITSTAPREFGVTARFAFGSR